ncbi:hypothetical protein RFI_31003, partial [Reticulomyxa filosa]
SNSTKPLVKVANRIWLDNEFEAQVKSSYVSAVGQDNFYMLDLQANGSLQLINNWIENQTDGKLQAIHTKKKKTKGKRCDDTCEYIIHKWSLVSTIFGKYDKQKPILSDESRTNVKTEIHLMHQIGHFDYYENRYFQFVKLRSTNTNNLFVFLALLKCSTCQTEIDNDVVKNALT